MIKRVAAVMICVAALMITAHTVIIPKDHECVINHDLGIVINDESIMCKLIISE